MEHHHVLGGAGVPRLRRRVAVRRVQLFEHVVFAHAAALPLAPDFRQDGLRAAQRAPFRRFARRDRAQHPRRVDERLLGVEALEQLDEAREVARRGRLAADPAAKADLMHEALHVLKHLELAALAQAVDRFLRGGVHLLEKTAHALGGEKMAEETEIAFEQLARQLEADQRTRRFGEAGCVFRAARTRLRSPCGREDEEQPETEDLEQERIAVQRPHRDEKRGRIAQKRPRGPDQRQSCHARRRR